MTGRQIDTHVHTVLLIVGLWGQVFQSSFSQSSSNSLYSLAIQLDMIGSYW